MAPRISVVTAVYNAEKEVRVLLDSLCASQFKDFEICLCDDASSDQTKRVIESFAEKLPLLVTSNATNHGVTYSRNRALAMARCPLLLFLDADVRVYPDTIDKLLGRLEKGKVDVVVGIYSPLALDQDIFPRYYALFAHHSFLAAGTRPSPYNVFNGWCALARRQVMDDLAGHEEVAKGVEVENETLGRRIVANGYTLVMDPQIAVDHHWGGLPKLLYIFTVRVYWWVKVFFATGFKFETALTTRSYGAATLCLPLSLVLAACGRLHPAAPALAGLPALFFFAGYAPFYAFVFRREGASFLAVSILLSALFSFPVTLSALYSLGEEILRLLRLKGTTLDPKSFA